jgi:HPt (histidine-containing phosphotransfer) domain-containing protein
MKFDLDLLNVFFNRFDDAKRERMMDVYVTSFENHIENCTKAIEEKDHAQLKAASHDLKSLCLILGAEETGSLAAGIGQSAASAEDSAFEDTAELLQQVEQIVTVIKAARSESD